MTYIVNDNCINCKYTDCVEVCPVDCSMKAKTLVIHPDECIDCGVCEPECARPFCQIRSRALKSGWINHEMSEIWPNIAQRCDPLPNAKEAEGETGKFEKYFTKIL